MDDGADVAERDHIDVRRAKDRRQRRAGASFESIVNEPPVISASILKSGTPRRPCGRARRENGSITLFTCSSLMPQPLSVTVMASVSPGTDSSIRIVVSDAPARIEFCTMSITFSESSRMALRRVLGEDLIDVLRHKAAVNVLVDREDRGEAAGADAAAGRQREQAVLRTFLRLDAELRDEAVEHLVRALDVAGGARQTEMLYLPFGVSENCE